MERTMPVGRPTTLKERNNVECPSCGSILTRSRGGGRSVDEHRIRRRYCETCRELFCTVEIPLRYADGSLVPFSAVVPDYALANRLRQRVSRGYHSTTAGRHPYSTPARLVVAVKVSRPDREPLPGPWPLILE